MKAYQRIYLFLIVMLMGGYSSFSMALTCKVEDSVSAFVDIGSILKASIGEYGANNKIWVSEPLSARASCSDTDSNPQGEDAYIWLDPKNAMSNVHESLEIGITWEGDDYPLKNGVKLKIGKGTTCRRVFLVCASPATGNSFTFSYQVYIKTTGKNASENGQVYNSNQLSLFQIDGERGIKSGTDSNFNLYITGLSKITFMGCTPKITLTPSVLNFETMTNRQALAGRIQAHKTFSVNVALPRETGGKDCQGETLMMTLSSNYPVVDNSIIMPSETSGFGFIISENANFEPRINMNTPQTLGVISGDSVTRQYYAGFIWTSNTPKLGDYTATATVTVTFK